MKIYLIYSRELSGYSKIYYNENMIEVKNGTTLYCTLYSLNQRPYK